MANRREEVYNVTLAQLLRQRGAAKAEAEKRFASDMPDVLLEWYGVSTVLEAQYEPQGAADHVTQQIEDRLKAGFGPLGLSVLYPRSLKTADGDPGDLLATSPFRVRLTAVGRKPGPWRSVNGLEGLTATLDDARAALVSDDELAASVTLLSSAVDALARVIRAQPGHAEEIVQLVTAQDAAPLGGATVEEKEAAFRVAGLAVITAVMLQLILSDRDPKVPAVPEDAPTKQRQALTKSWQVILAHNYKAVFEIAHAVLNTLGDSEPGLGPMLLATVSQARGIVAKGVMGRHDLVGRVYHGLLEEQKFLATYYTSVPAATLLATIATDPAQWPDVDWGAEPSDFNLSIVDPACGTGTLLAAALSAIRRHYATARLAQSKGVDADALGRLMLEEKVLGFDILAYAVQVCAATLLLSTPGTTVSKSRLAQLPFGGPEGDLGSLDLLRGSTEGSLFGAWGDTVSIDGTIDRNVLIDLPEVDLVIMNPPFTRSQGGSRLLGSLDPDDFPVARKNLTNLSKQEGHGGRLAAGLGALFVPLADRMIRYGGRMAFVLPKTMLTGAQWDRTRRLLSEKYHVEFVICSHQPGHWNFSDSTDLAEILLVARKWKEGENRKNAVTRWLQLSENPTTAIDAHGIATALLAAPIATKAEELRLGSGLFSTPGEVFSRPAPTTDTPWHGGAFYKEVLLRAAESLVAGRFELPRVATPINVPLRRLGELGSIGYDRRDITDAFEVVATPSGYPALWGTDAKVVTSLSHSPNAELAPRSQVAPGRQRIKPAEPVWGGAGRLLLAERLRLITMRCAAIVVQDRCLSNTWWTMRLDSGSVEDDKLLCLWLNSTFGLLLWIYMAEETQGPWLALKKNKLVDLPVMDPGALSSRVRADLLKCWDEVHELELAPISRLGDDPARAVIDAAIGTALKIPADGVQALRLLFAAEPRLVPAPRLPKKPGPSAEAPPETLPLFG